MCIFGKERRQRFSNLTSDTPEVVVDVLVQPGGVDLLAVEVGKVLLEDLIGGLVRLPEVLQNLDSTRGIV